MQVQEAIQNNNFTVTTPGVCAKGHWLTVLDSNCSIVIDILKKQGAQKSTLMYGKTCFLKLKEYLLENNLQYSPDVSLKWYESERRSPRIGLMLQRLQDVYETGSIRTKNMPRLYNGGYKVISNEWKLRIDQFADTFSVAENEKHNIKIDCGLFVELLQNLDIHKPSEILLSHVLTFVDQEQDRFKYSTLRSKLGHVQKFLQYLHDTENCPWICALYLEALFSKSIITLQDFTLEQKNTLENIKAESLDFPAYELSELIAPFIARLNDFGYKDTAISVSSFTLKSLYVFLELHGFGYHIDIAVMWLEALKKRYNNNCWMAVRRCIELFNLYTIEGDLLPRTIFTHTPIQLDLLPDWCKEKVLPYLELKKTEGSENSTVVMIRSCLVRFCRFLCSRGLTSFSEITPDLLSEFNISDPHRTSEAKNAYNSRIRKFLQYLEHKHSVPYRISSALMCTHAPKEDLVSILTDDELSIINEAQETAASPIELRDAAIIAIGLEMGVRGADIVALNIDSINWRTRSIKFTQQKTGREVELPMPVQVGNTIYKYIKYGRPKTEEKALFLTEKAPYRRVCRASGSYGALKRTLPERNVPGQGFHATRKTFATNEFRNGVDPSVIADLLGQTDEESLKPYLSLDEDRMRLCPISLEEAELQLSEDYYEAT